MLNTQPNIGITKPAPPVIATGTPAVPVAGGSAVQSSNAVATTIFHATAYAPNPIPTIKLPPSGETTVTVAVPMEDVSVMGGAIPAFATASVIVESDVITLGGQLAAAETA